jgi:hypothetical protein
MDSTFANPDIVDMHNKGLKTQMLNEASTDFLILLLPVSVIWILIIKNTTKYLKKYILFVPIFIKHAS